MATGFVFKNHDMAIEYMKRRDRLGLKTEKECHELLLRMTLEGKMEKVFSNKRTPDQWLTDQRKKGFKIEDHRRPNHVPRRTTGNNTKSTPRGFFRELARLVKVHFLGGST